MAKKPFPIVEVTLDTIVGGGQTLGTLEDGKKIFVWGGLPDERVRVQVTKKKSNLNEGIVTEVLEASDERVTPRDPESYISTSPWQIMTFDAEAHYKAALIEEAFELHDIVLPEAIEVWSDGQAYAYRNKVEYSWWWDKEAETLDLAFFRRGTKGKISVEGTSLARPEIDETAHAVRDILRTRRTNGFDLKTVMIRANQAGKTVFQLYLKAEEFDDFTETERARLPSHVQGYEIIHSNPKSPASVITKRLHSYGDIVLSDTVYGVPFHYATEGFFQINLPVYEQALHDMEKWVGSNVEPLSLPLLEEDVPTRASQAPQAELRSPVERPLKKDGGESGDVDADSTNGNWIPDQAWNDTEANTKQPQHDHNDKVIDLYSGVGTIGLTIGGSDVTLVELNEHAVREMERNIVKLGRIAEAKPVLAASEQALEYITGDAIIIVDPPRAGLHQDVVDRLLETQPDRIIYLSCNPVTQARDVARLADIYGIRAHRGYNFFPRTPHIEHLVILDKKQNI